MLVHRTKPAADNSIRICDYTLEHFNPAQARRAALAILETAESLNSLPNRGRQGRKANTRELMAPGLPHLIVYRVRSSAIDVLAPSGGSNRRLLERADLSDD